MKLNWPERIEILKMLPEEGHLHGLVAAEAVTAKLGVTDAEKAEFEWEEFEIQPGVQHFRWQNLAAANAEKQFDLSESERMLIVQCLHDREQAGKLPRAALPVYRKFMIGGPEAEAVKA